MTATTTTTTILYHIEHAGLWHSRATNDHGDGDKHGALPPVDVLPPTPRRRACRCSVAEKFERTCGEMHTRDYNEDDDRRQVVVVYNVTAGNNNNNNKCAGGVQTRIVLCRTIHPPLPHHHNYTVLFIHVMQLLSTA